MQIKYVACLVLLNAIIPAVYTSSVVSDEGFSIRLAVNILMPNNLEMMCSFNQQNFVFSQSRIILKFANDCDEYISAVSCVRFSAVYFSGNLDGTFN